MASDRQRHLTGIDGGRAVEPPVYHCAEEYCLVVVADEGDLCEPCDLARSISLDYQQSMGLDGGGD